MDERDKTGVGVGAAVGGATGGVAGAAAAGAMIGGVTGPVGAAAGAVAGAVVGAMAGKGLATTADLAEQDRYWRDNHATRPYGKDGSYDDYGPAYLYGAGAHARHPGRSFEEAEAELGGAWPASRGASTLEWSHARHAARDAWQRVSDAAERALPGDADRDGR